LIKDKKARLDISCRIVSPPDLDVATESRDSAHLLHDIDLTSRVQNWIRGAGVTIVIPLRRGLRPGLLHGVVAIVVANVVASLTSDHRKHFQRSRNFIQVARWKGASRGGGAKVPWTPQMADTLLSLQSRHCSQCSDIHCQATLHTGSTNLSEDDISNKDEQEAARVSGLTP
jgi:hypothetical protein